MRPIGGYFSLELSAFPEYHTNGIRLNSGRFGLEYILRCRKYTKVYVPYFTCDTAVDPIIKLGIAYEFYHINQDYHIVEDIHLNEGEALMYTNYWGLQTPYCKYLAQIYGRQLILDYTQAFFETPILGIDTFNSCRKFFGVPDGGYVFTESVADFQLEQDQSYTRMDSLVKRIDISPEAGYADFRKASEDFHHVDMCLMSKFTQRMMQSIDYAAIATRRCSNYEILRHALGGDSLPEGAVPMVFPYQTEKGQQLRQHLIQNKIFVAKYWPNVEEWSPIDSYEIWMANHILPLPIDQRYGEEDMKFIIDSILCFN